VRVLFYKTSSGRIPVLEFIGGLSRDVQEQFWDALRLLEKGEMLAMPTSRMLSSIHPGLNELRFKDLAGIYRVFYYVRVKDAIYLLHAFQKKTQETPPKETKLVIRRIKEI
jgi:phage-related protein